MEKKELEDYMLKQIPDNCNLLEGIIGAVAAGIVKAKEIESKELAASVLKEFHHLTITRGM